MNIRISAKYPLIHQIYISDSNSDFDMPNKCLVTQTQFGEVNYRFWTLELIRKFLSESYSADVLSTFDRLKPFAFKADLARYCIVNTFGGTYADIGIIFVNSLDIESREMVIFRDGNSDRTSWKVANNFFYSRPNNPILVDSIESILRNVKTRYYRHDAHFIGGPSVFGRSVAKYGLEVDLNVGQYYWFKYRRDRYVLPDGTVAARHKRGGASKGGISGLAGGNNYNEIWRARQVYGENIGE